MIFGQDNFVKHKWINMQFFSTMPLKEKIIQIYLTFIFISLGYSRKLVLIPFILDIKIKNQFLVDLTKLLFKPIDIILTPLGYIVAVSGPMMIFFGLLVFIVGFFLFAIESFLLSKIIIFIFKKMAPENFFERFYFVVRKKISGSYPNSFNWKWKNSNKFEKIKYYFPVLIFVILLFVLYPAISSLTDKKKEDKEKQNVSLSEQANKMDDNIDSDSDGLNDRIEFILGTDIYNADTDKDGHNDYDELKNGYNPFIVSPNDKLDDDVDNLAKSVAFDIKGKKFSELDQLKIKLKNQSPSGLCGSNSVSANGLSDNDKAKKAITTKDPCECSKVLDDKYKNACYAQLAGLTGNEILCKYIAGSSSDVESAKSKCLHNLMLATLNEKYCFEIKEIHDQANCFMVLALKTKRYNLCDSIIDGEEKDSCYWKVAIFSKNTSLCEKINPERIGGSDRESCINMSKLFP